MTFTLGIPLLIIFIVMLVLAMPTYHKILFRHRSIGIECIKATQHGISERGKMCRKRAAKCTLSNF